MTPALDGCKGVTDATRPNKQSEKTRNRAGRPPGSKNKRTLEIEEYARAHAGDAIAALVEIATHGESESARVSAAIALLDRGYGKPRQSVEYEDVTKLPREERRERLLRLLS